MTTLLSLDANAHSDPARTTKTLADSGAVLAMTLSFDEAARVVDRRGPHPLRGGGRRRAVGAAHGALVGLEMRRKLGYTAALRDDHRLILIDARGHGQSEAPRDSAHYVPELMAGDLTAVLDALEIPAARFLGDSMGAAIGFEIARRTPQRFKSLVLLGYGRYGPAAASEQQFNAAGQRLYEMGAALGGEATVAAVDPAGSALSPATRAAFLAKIGRRSWHSTTPSKSGPPSRRNCLIWRCPS